ncbi:hypothetical protein HY992_05620 [Candidatus Micrarchaeota archaeon]|nr:hypothetical protein [Candidatus Micrarchaeota archaeon]
MRTERHLLHACTPEPVTAEVLPALKKLFENQTIKKGETVVLLFTGSGKKTLKELQQLLTAHGFEKEWQALERTLGNTKANANYTKERQPELAIAV